MKNPRRSRLARLRDRLTTVAMAVWGLIIFVLVALFWPVAFVLAGLWLVGREFDDGFDDL